MNKEDIEEIDNISTEEFENAESEEFEAVESEEFVESAESEEAAESKGKFDKLLGEDAKKFRLTGMFREWFLD